MASTVDNAKQKRNSKRKSIFMPSISVAITSTHTNTATEDYEERIKLGMKHVVITHSHVCPIYVRVDDDHYLLTCYCCGANCGDDKKYFPTYEALDDHVAHEHPAQYDGAPKKYKKSVDKASECFGRCAMPITKEKYDGLATGTTKEVMKIPTGKDGLGIFNKGFHHGEC